MINQITLYSFPTYEMDCNEKLASKEKVIGSNTSSSAVSSAEAKEHVLDATNSPESLQQFLKSFSKDLCCSNFSKEKKLSGSSRCKVVEQKRGMKENKTSDQFSKKQPRKGENPVRIPSLEYYSDLAAKPLICKNSACKAILAPEDAFCRRCSCCICHIYDDNKDPSLWLVCSSESGDQDSCGLSCHIECALEHQKVGVVNFDHFMQLDGSYCCASCGKVSGIIGCWRKQLLVAKDARRVDVLCHRIWLSFRLLDGTSRFRELHNVTTEAKAKLETEVGALDGVSAKMARGIVSRLAIAGELQELCCVAIEKADRWLDSVVTPNAVCREGGSLPAACKFQFEEITSSSIVIVLKEASSPYSNSIKGYKLWYEKSREQPLEKEPIVFPRSRRRILISNLQPCTEYTFRIISFAEMGDFGHSESKCFTKSVEITQKNLENTGTEGQSFRGKRRRNLCPTSSSGFKVRDLGKILRAAWAEEHSGIDGFSYDGIEESTDGNLMKPEAAAEGQQPCVFVTHGLDLNVTNVPDLNIDVAPSSDCSPSENNGCASSKKEGPAGSNESNDSLTWADKPSCEVPGLESQLDFCKKQTLNASDDGASSLINCTPFHNSAGKLELDDHYEYCVKVVRWLECQGYVEREFRMKFLTWFSLRSTKQERRVVRTFIDTLIDDPGSLAGQLMDSFLEIVLSKRPRNGFCSKLWH